MPLKGTVVAWAKEVALFWRRARVCMPCAAGIVLLAPLLEGCHGHSFHSLDGHVYSVPPPVTAPGEDLDTRPLPQALVTAQCRGWTLRLDVSDEDGRVHYEAASNWLSDCVIIVWPPDERHETRRFRVADLCRSAGQAPSCQRLRLEAELPRTAASAEPQRIALRFEPKSEDVILYSTRGGKEQVVCRGSCTTELLAGDHFLHVGVVGSDDRYNASHLTLRTDTTLKVGVRRGDPVLMNVGGVLMFVGALGVYGTLYALWKEKETLAWVAGSTAVVGAGVGFPLLFLSLPEVSWDAVPTTTLAR
jgi:hypothetical protein